MIQNLMLISLIYKNKFAEIIAEICIEIDEKATEKTWMEKWRKVFDKVRQNYFLITSLMVDGNVTHYVLMK